MRHVDFAVFILSHGRAARVKTLRALRNGNYKGRVILVCDNEDEQLEDYKKLGEVVVFDKSKVMQETDTADNFQKHNVVVYARNACWDIAKQQKIKYFLVLDDDYTRFSFRFPEERKLAHKLVDDLNNVFDLMLDFLDVSGALTVAFGQGGELIGGVDDRKVQSITRKAMNSFFCRTDRPFQFTGTLNEDVNAYVTLSHRGHLFFTIHAVSITQDLTQKNAGGLTEAYLDLGTYVKSFYSVIHRPDCVKISVMGRKYQRIHHKINWNNCCPKIINEKYRKGQKK